MQGFEPTTFRTRVSSYYRCVDFGYSDSRSNYAYRFQVTAHARLASWEESIQQARTACEAWKKETALATNKMEQAIKEKESVNVKANQLQKELDGLNGGPHLHAVARIEDLKTQPMSILKTIEWQLRKDLQEVEKVS